MDNTKRFDGRAKDYTEGRPGYAPELIDCLYREYGFSENSVIADIGSGTGKFAYFLLQRGSKVFCVEPNDDMRHMAEKELSAYPNYYSVKGDAENTALGNESVDIVTAAQAFHWFDVQKFKRECSRILRDNGRVVLLWNVRNMTDRVNKELYDIFTRYCPSFKGFSGGVKKDDSRIREFFDDRYVRVEFDNPLFLDREKFIGRCLSGSYSLLKGDNGFAEYIGEINVLFDRLAVDGIVRIGNSSVAYIGSIR